MISTFQHFMIFFSSDPPIQHFNISTFQHFMGSSNISTFQHFNISWAVPTFQHFNISTFYEHIRQTPHRFHISTFQHFNISQQLPHISRPDPPPPRPQVCDSSHPTQHIEWTASAAIDLWYYAFFERFRVCFVRAV